MLEIIQSKVNELTDDQKAEIKGGTIIVTDVNVD